MRPLSNDLRERILDAVDNREGSRRQPAARSEVDASTITKLLRLRRETGSYGPRPHAGGAAPALDHESFAEEVEPIGPHRLAFVDEAGVTTAMTPACGRAPKGERVEAPAPAPWGSVTAIAAMAADGARAPLALPGPGNAPASLA